MSAVLGTEIGNFLRRLPESKGIKLHLQQEVAAIGDNEVKLQIGEVLTADLVAVGMALSHESSCSSD